MTEIVVKVDIGSASKLLNELSRRTSNLRPALLEIREVLVESSQRRFVDERGPDGQPWQALSAKTLKSRKKKTSRFPAGILKQSGQLMENISGEATTSALTIFSPERYSAIQQLGGNTSRGGRIPARPFLGISESDQRAIKSVLEDHLTRK